MSEPIEARPVAARASLAKRLARRLPFGRRIAAMGFAALDRRTPMWVKGTVMLAAAYFALPVDLVSDLLPLVGLTDDAGLALAAYKALSSHTTDEHQAQALDWLERER